MKILQINKFYYLKGGSERYFFDLSEILKKNGHKIIPFSMQDDNNLPSKYTKYFIKKVDLNKFNLINILKFFYNYDAVKRLKKLIKYEKPDIAHLHNIAHQFSPEIIRILKKNNIKIAQTLHDYKLICPNAKLFAHNQNCEKCQGGKYYNCLKRKCVKNSYLKSFMAALEAYLWNRLLKVYNKVDMFIAPSKFMRDKCADFGVPEEKIKVVYNFYDAPVNGEIEVKNTEKYILYYGRLSKEKGVDVLLEAMRSVKGEFKLKIVGSGPEYKHLERQINKFNLQDRVSLLGPKYGKDLQIIINQAMVVVLPSLWPENMPYCLLEPMAIGKTMIVSRVGGMTEIIKDKENGFSFAPGDFNVLANIINNLEKFDYKKIGEEAKETIKKLNSKNHYQKILKVYTELRK
ncbi:glycosyltransferase family 4 protein [Candidatus Parcubacteria bacterium]|nr:glycosyltransferase family 4 protein [Candidatus Parcubacteria bacterium]